MKSFVWVRALLPHPAMTIPLSVVLPKLRARLAGMGRGRARLAIGVMAGQKPATAPVGMVHDQTAMAREHGFGVVYFVQESLLRFKTPGETVESRFEALRLLAPEASTRR